MTGLSKSKFNAFNADLSNRSTFDLIEVPKKSIEIVENLSAIDVIKKAQGGTNHIIQRDCIDFDAELRTAQLMVDSPKSFLRDPIGSLFLEPIKDLSVYSAKFESTEKKHQLLEDLDQFISTLAKPRGLFLPATLIADELFTNAAKNSWAQDQIPFADKPTRPGKMEFIFAASETRLLIGCRDTFGQLPIKHLLNRIYTCLDSGIAKSIQKKTWGAGIGTSFIFDASMSFYAAVEPGRQTLVCASIAVGLGRRKSDLLAKNVHLLEALST